MSKTGLRLNSRYIHQGITKIEPKVGLLDRVINRFDKAVFFLFILFPVTELISIPVQIGKKTIYEPIGTGK